jgi:hypothetical protein
MKLTHYPTPHLFGTIEYRPGDRLRPDGDTIHLRDPVLLLGGRRTRPEDGKLEVWIPGHTRPRILELKGDDTAAGRHLTIRLSGLHTAHVWGDLIPCGTERRLSGQ